MKQHFQIPWAQILIVCAALVMALGMGGLCSGGARSGGATGSLPTEPANAGPVPLCPI